MNCYYVSIIANMRMCIVFGWFAMSRPSGMTDSTGTRHRSPTIGFFRQNF